MSPSTAGAATRPASFAAMGLSPELVQLLAERGISEPLPIQAATIPDAMAGRDVSGKAPTGSGKTLAFSLPMVATLPTGRRQRPVGLVLAPTRELASQIAAELTPLAAVRHLRVRALYGGVGFGPQINALRRGVDIVVACPGRLEDLMGSGHVRLDQVEIAVVDEADRMADMGFLPAVRRILDATRAERQTLLYSATLDGNVDVLVRHYQRDPVRHEIAADEADLSRTTHRFQHVAHAGRAECCAQLVAGAGPTVVFVRTRHGADRLARQLTRSGVTAAAIHGDRSQSQRERALRAFRSGDVRALVATDVAARGIHVDDVACVIHFDLPADPKDYVHRSGRTARAGADGVVIALVTPEHQAAADTLRKALHLTPEMDGDRHTPEVRTSPAPAERRRRTRPPGRHGRRPQGAQGQRRRDGTSGGRRSLA